MRAVCNWSHMAHYYKVAELARNFCQGELESLCPRLSFVDQQD